MLTATNARRKPHDAAAEHARDERRGRPREHRRLERPARARTSSAEVKAPIAMNAPVPSDGSPAGPTVSPSAVAASAR